MAETEARPEGLTAVSKTVAPEWKQGDVSRKNLLEPWIWPQHCIHSGSNQAILRHTKVPYTELSVKDWEKQLKRRVKWQKQKEEDNSKE